MQIAKEAQHSNRWSPIDVCTISDPQMALFVEAYSRHVRRPFIDRLLYETFDNYQMHPDMRPAVTTFLEKVFEGLTLAAIGLYHSEQLLLQYEFNVAAFTSHMPHTQYESLLHILNGIDLLEVRLREVENAEGASVSPLEAELANVKRAILDLEVQIRCQLSDLEKEFKEGTGGQKGDVCYGWMLPRHISGALWQYRLPPVLDVCSRHSATHTSSSNFTIVDSLRDGVLHGCISGDGGGMSTSMGDDICHGCHRMCGDETVSEDPDARNSGSLPSLEMLVTGKAGIEPLRAYHIPAVESPPSGIHRCLDCSVSICRPCQRLFAKIWTLYRSVANDAHVSPTDKVVEEALPKIRGKLLEVNPHFTHSISGLEKFSNLSQTRIHRPGLPVEHRMLAAFAKYQNRPVCGVIAASLADFSGRISASEDHQPPFRDFTPEDKLDEICESVSKEPGTIPLPRRHAVRWMSYGELFEVVQSMASMLLPLCPPTGEEPARFGVSIGKGVSNINLLWHAVDAAVLFAGGCSVGLPSDWSPEAICDAAALANVTAMIVDHLSLMRLLDFLSHSPVPGLRCVFVVIMSDEHTQLGRERSDLVIALQQRNITIPVFWAPSSFFATPRGIDMCGVRNINPLATDIRLSNPEGYVVSSTRRVLHEVRDVHLERRQGQYHLPNATPRDRAIFVIFSSGTSGSKAKGIISREGMYLGDTLNSGGGTVAITAVSAYSPAWATDKVTFWTSFFAGGRLGFQPQKELLHGHGFVTIFDTYATFRPSPTMILVPIIATQMKQHFEIVRSSLISNGSSIETAHALACTILYFRYLGGRISGLSLGGAKVPPELVTFFKENVPIDAVDGMGTTETGGVFRDGSPDNRAHIKLIDRPEIGYTQHDKPFPRGEVAVRVTANKVIPEADWVADEETKRTTIHNRYIKIETTEQEGDQLVPVKHTYILTGDVASFDPETGSYRVVDRVSALRKMVHGRFFSPEEVESAILEPLATTLAETQSCYSARLEHCVVDLSEREDSTVVLLRVVDSSARPFALPSHEAVALLGLVQRWCAQSNVSRDVTPQAIIFDIVEAPWSAANGCLTHTSKVLRNGVRRHRILPLLLEGEKGGTRAQPHPAAVDPQNNNHQNDPLDVPSVVKELCKTIFPELTDSELSEVSVRTFSANGVDSIALGQLASTLKTCISRLTTDTNRRTSSLMNKRVAQLVSQGRFVIPLLMGMSPQDVCSQVVALSDEEGTAHDPSDSSVQTPLADETSSVTTPPKLPSNPTGSFEMLRKMAPSLPDLVFSTGALLECGYGATYLQSLQAGIALWWKQRLEECKLELVEASSSCDEDHRRSRRVLITGVTGFLGVTVLRKVLEQEPTDQQLDVHCVVRGPDAKSRLHRIFTQSTEGLDADHQAALMDRFGSAVTILEADLATDELLSRIPAEWHYDCIIHCAATVKSWGSSEANLTSLLEANVLGTLRIALIAGRSASLSRKATRVVFISTSGVTNSLGEIVRRADTDGEMKPNSLRDIGGLSAFRSSVVKPYNLSKFIAESELRKALDQLKAPVQLILFRPPLLVWDSKTGYRNPDDWFVRLIDSCVQSGIAPISCPGSELTVDCRSVDEYATEVKDCFFIEGDFAKFVVKQVRSDPLDLNSTIEEVSRRIHLRQVPAFAWVAALRNSKAPFPYAPLLPAPLERAIPKAAPPKPITTVGHPAGFVLWLAKQTHLL